MQVIDGCSLELYVLCSHTFSGVIWRSATEINSMYLHDSFVMIPLECISLHNTHVLLLGGATAHGIFTQLTLFHGDMSFQQTFDGDTGLPCLLKG